jgi:predicted RecA/RadA family phage recombinase
VNQGDPVVVGDMVGIAMTSAAAATDYINIDTEGIWNLTITGTRSDGTTDGGDVAIAIGDQIYIDITAADLTTETDAVNHRPFGIALGATAAGTATVVAVKVHGDQSNFRKINVGVFGGPVLLDVDAYGDAGRNGPAWLRAYVSSSSIIEADEELIGIYARVNNGVAGDVGTVVGAEFKAIQDATNTSQLAQSLGIKANCDLRGEGAVHQHGIEVLVEGACTASDHRSGIRFISRDTVGTLEALFSLEQATTFGSSVDTLTTESYALPVNVAGTLHYIQLYST